MNKQPMEVDEGNMDYLEPCRDIVLHEDKQYYPSAAKIFGADVQTLIQEEDAQPLTQPIIQPTRKNDF